MDSLKFKKTPKQKLTLFLMLVFFVCINLFVSTLISSSIAYYLLTIGILPPLSAHGFPVILLFIWLASLIIGTVIAIIGINYIIRPVRALTEATKEVAAGNFNVKVKACGASEISRLGVNFNKMTQELSSVEALRSDFVHNISHEFKTPIVSIRGFATRLKKDNLTEEQRHKYLDIIIDETERLTNLSSNVLLLSKLESTDRIAEKTVYSLDEQIRKCILLLEPQFQKKQLELNISLDAVQFMGNEEILQPLWINLLSNAIKFSAEKGVITVNLKSDGGNAIASVCDEGIGMSEEIKGHVFDKFFQGDSSRAMAGNGLGLSLVKRIVELSDGRITVDSEPGEGACFTVSLPLNS